MDIYASQVSALKTLAKEAGDIIMRYYEGEVAVELKADDSPVTAADLAANAVIVERLNILTPDIPVVSEEVSESENMTAGQAERFWLVDPLDGTKSFIKRTGEFTVNIALIENAVPIGGVVYVPATGALYYVGEDGRAYREYEGNTQQIQVREAPEDIVVAVASRSHATAETDAYLDTLVGRVERISVASSLKFCRVAEGEADIYPRFGRTMYWDTGAGHAVLAAAGGQVINVDQTPFTYQDKQGDFANPYFIAVSHQEVLPPVTSS